jgi:type VI secretion system protein ImpA
MPLRPDLLTPIAGDQPAGPYLRYDPIYDKIKEARKEDPFADPPVKADWRMIHDLTSEAIAKRSKDLQLAGWLTEAQLRREGIAGLREGLQLLVDLLEQFWDQVHPVIEDGDVDMRAAPLAWVGSYIDVGVRLAPVDAKGVTLAQYLESRTVPTEEEAKWDEEKGERRKQALADKKFTPEQFEEGFAATPKAWYKQFLNDADAAIELAKRIEKIGDERLGDSAPGYKGLRDALNDIRVAAAGLLRRKLEVDPDPADEEPIDLDVPETTGDGTVSIEPRNRQDAANRIAVAARFLRKETPTDPAPYLMLRGFRWGELRTGAETPDPRLLAAPPTEIRTRLKGMLLDSKWAELLEAGEEIMATPFGRGWLDLQRYVLTACEGLGDKYGAVTVAIQGAVRSLLRDVPGLIDATLMDDSPTANAETRGWLRMRGVLGGSQEDEEAEAERAASPISSSALDRTVASLRASQPQRAIELLLRAVSQEKSERARFMRRAEAASIMVSNGLEAVAMPILQEMIELLDQHNLEAWESGDTIARPLGLLYRCLAALDEDTSTRQALYLRVCRLDPMQAIELTTASQNHDAGT